MLLPGLLLLGIEALHTSTYNNASIDHNAHKAESLPGGAVKHIKEGMQQAACTLFCNILQIPNTFGESEKISRQNKMQQRQPIASKTEL